MGDWRHLPRMKAAKSGFHNPSRSEPEPSSSRPPANPRSSAFRTAISTSMLCAIWRQRPSRVSIAPVNDPDPHLGKIYGNVKLTKLLGRGAMGAVYQGWHLR